MKRFSATGNKVLDADRLAEGKDPEIATAIDDETAAYIANALELCLHEF